jgi:hypothetical protein
VQGEALLHAAVANNARWCDAVCRSHGHPGVFTARVWISARHTLAFYPNAITLSPDVTAAETEAGRHQPYAVKDSFARLDLAGEGLEPIFDADWIARLPAPPEPSEDYLCWDSVTGPGELAQWEAAWAGADTAVAPRSRPALFRPELLADPRCAILACRREGALVAGAIIYTTGQVTGISNVFSTGLPAGLIWASAVQAVVALRPGLPLVGYERGADLAAARQAGCQVLGPLRVWASAPSRPATAPPGHRTARG